MALAMVRHRFKWPRPKERWLKSGKRLDRLLVGMQCVSPVAEAPPAPTGEIIGRTMPQGLGCANPRHPTQDVECNQRLNGIYRNRVMATFRRLQMQRTAHYEKAKW